MAYDPRLLQHKTVDYSESSHFRTYRRQRKCYLNVDPLDDDLVGSDNGAESLSVSSMSSSSTRTTVHNQIESFGHLSPANPDFITRRFSTSHESQTAPKPGLVHAAESNFHEAYYQKQMHRASAPDTMRVHQSQDDELPALDYFSNNSMRLNSDPLASPSGNVNETPPSRRSLLPEPDLSPPSPPAPSKASGSYIGEEHSWHDSMVLAVALLEGIKMVDMGELPRRRRDRNRDRRAGNGAPHR
jgi:hypothetical protein